jgi:hypothetical protein
MLAAASRPCRSDCHDPCVIGQLMLMSAHDFAQPPPNSISHNGATNFARSDESSAHSFSRIPQQNAERNKSTPRDSTLFANALKLSRACQSSRFRKREITRHWRILHRFQGHEIKIIVSKIAPTK